MVDFAEVRGALDDKRNFGDIAGTGWHRDAVYERFSDQEYRRRHEALGKSMDALGLDALIVGGGPSHWSSGGGMLWLTGHFEWHALACYVLVPRTGEPVLVYSMGGSHIETVRNVSWVKDVRPSRNGRFGEVLVEAIREKGLSTARIGHPPIDPRHLDYMPVNQYRDIEKGLPGAELVFIHDVFHELMVVKSPEELECVRRAGQLCVSAFRAMVERARPGVTEEGLRGAAASAIFEGGGDVDFLIIASTATRDPHLIFGSPRPSRRMLREGDVVLNELAAGYRGYTAQIGMPIFVGEPDPSARAFYEQITLPGFSRMARELAPGRTLADIEAAGRFFRDNGYQSRPILLHGIDLVTSEPHVYVGDDKDEELRPGQVVMLEPNPIRSDGQLGMFFGHTFIITDDGNEIVTEYPLEMIVVD
ncbi:MAG TPA: Xaa-Pro peptidase family protein [Actinomycetota bacterium]|nr:Xaa-Pro peptidase family protein [Actinomycetota bacterium]